MVHVLEYSFFLSYKCEQGRLIVSMSLILLGIVHRYLVLCEFFEHSRFLLF